MDQKETEAGSPGEGKGHDKIDQGGGRGREPQETSRQVVGWAGKGRAMTMLRPRKGLGDNEDVSEMAVRGKRMRLETLRPVWMIHGRPEGCPGEVSGSPWDPKI